MGRRAGPSPVEAVQEANTAPAAVREMAPEQVAPAAPEGLVDLDRPRSVAARPTASTAKQTVTEKIRGAIHLLAPAVMRDEDAAPADPDLGEQAPEGPAMAGAQPAAAEVRQAVGWGQPGEMAARSPRWNRFLKR